MHSGQKFAKWTLLREVEGGKNPKWLCRCACGREKITSVNNIVYGKSISCGCVQKAIASKIHKKHGKSDHPLYKCWARIWNRCSNSNAKDFKHYGGRGIKVDARWENFDAFWEDMSPSWKEGLSIERINVDGDYTKLNCRWATQSEQMRNTRSSILLDTPIGRVNLTTAAEVFGINPRILRQRLRKGFMSDRLFESGDGRIGNKRSGFRARKNPS